MECAAIVAFYAHKLSSSRRRAATAKHWRAHGLHAEQDVSLKPRTRTTTSHEDEDEDEHDNEHVLATLRLRGGSGTPR
jgi:hypothetical protein